MIVRNMTGAEKLEDAMNLPKTDSIRELAEFWDVHYVTDFADELVEVDERVFARRCSGVTVSLTASERRALQDLAASQGVDQAALIRTWVREKLHQ
jgi:hypothetical protein